MTKYIMTTLILATILVAGLFSFFKIGDRQFREFDYDPTDWVSTQYTLFSTSVSGTVYSPSHDFRWEWIPSGLQLKPIVRYRYDYVIVELPDGRRGIVLPSTLSGMRKEGSDFAPQNYSGWVIGEDVARRYGKLKEYSDESLPLIGMLSAAQLQKLDPSKSKSKSKNSKPSNLPGMIINGKSGYMAVTVDKLYPRFAESLPRYFDKFRAYISADKLEGLSREQIESQYGEPLSLAKLPDGGTRAFYRHLLTKDSYTYWGLYINYGSDGLAMVEDPTLISDKSDPGYVHRENAPFISRITSLDWVDLPLVYPILERFHFSIGDISYIDGSKAGIEQFLVNLIIVIISVVLLYYMLIAVLFPIRLLNNFIIGTISFVVPIAYMAIVGTIYLDQLQGIWLIVALAAPIVAVIPFFSISDLLKFNRCKKCHRSFCLAHKSKLLGKNVSYKNVHHDTDSVGFDDLYYGPKRNVDAYNSSDFDDWNKRITTYYRTTDTIETTESKYRYDFYCSRCSGEWIDYGSDFESHVIASRKYKTGRRIETVED